LIPPCLSRVSSKHFPQSLAYSLDLSGELRRLVQDLTMSDFAAT